MWLDDELLLMWEDTKVLTFEGASKKLTIEKHDYVPIALVDRVMWTKASDVRDNDEYVARCDIAIRDIYKWIKQRFLSFARMHADVAKLCTHLDGDLPDQYVELLYRTHAATLYDSYWICPACDLGRTEWKNVNPRRLPINEELQNMFLYGRTESPLHGYNSPEWTTQGKAPKAWVRAQDSKLYLYKGHMDETHESARMEIMCSKLLDKMPVKHVRYEAVVGGPMYCAFCELFTNDDTHMWLGTEIDKDPLTEGPNILIKLNNMRMPEVSYMYIVDYLLCNPNRSLTSFGFLYNTPDIAGPMAPLMNFDQAFSKEAMQDPDALYMGTRVPLRTAARAAIKWVDFYFTEPVVRDDFFTLEQYQEFNKRACDLMIPTLTRYELKVVDALKRNHVDMRLNEALEYLPDAELDDEALDMAVRGLL